jgi:tetratricopeptide (TPR) repeat protein
VSGGTSFRPENELQARAIAFLQFDAEPAANVEFPKPGDRVADFVVECEIGRGATGVVYRARQLSADRSVALKLVPHDREGLSGSELLRLQREGRILASVCHEAIIGLHAAGAVPGFHYVAVDLVDGVTLRQILQGRAPGFPRPGEPAWLPFVLRTLHKVAGALGAAHRRGIVHRDVKPANVLVDRTGRPFLVDFGLAREDRRTGATLTSGFVGTPQYASPEQARGEPLDARSDVFSFGSMAFEAVFGCAPFEGATTADLLASVRRDAPRWPDDRHVPRDVRTVLETCLENSPRDRYRDALEVEAELGRILRFERVRATRPGPVRRTWRRLRRPSARVVVAAAVFAVVALATIVASWTARRSALVARLEAQSQLAGIDSFFHRGDDDAYERALGPLFEIDPPLPGVAGRLADVRLLRDDFESAAALYERESATAPSLADWCGVRLARAALAGATPIDEPSAALRAQTDRDDALLALYEDARRRPAAALEAIDRAIALRPSCFAWRLERARCLRRLGRTTEAIGELRLANEIRRDDRRVTLPLAIALDAAGRHPEAEAVLRSALAAAPGDAVLLAELSVALRAQFRRDEAMSTARRALALAPEEPRVIDALATNLITEEAYDQARTLLESAAARHPDSPEIAHRRAYLERATGHLDAAKECANRLDALTVRNDDWTATALELHGLLQLDSGSTKDAIATFARLESMEPESAEGPWRLGKALLADDQASAAEAAVSRALAIDATRTDVLYTEGQVLRRLGRAWDALVVYERALALRPEWGQTYFWMADVWFDLGEPRAALRYLPLALERHPNWMDAWVLQAICEEKLGDLEAAADSYARALEARPHPPVRSDRGEILQRLGRDREALAEFERARRDDPNLATAWCGEGLLRLDSTDAAVRDPVEGERLLERALELDPDSDEYCGYVARARHDLGLE